MINRTIRKDLLLLLTLAIITPFMFITALYINNVKEIIDDDVKAYQEAIVKHSADNMTHIFSSIKMIQRATLGKIISDYINISYDTNLNLDEIIKLKDLIEYLYITDNASSYVNGIYIIFDSDYIVSSRIGIRENLLINQAWIKDVLETKNKELFTGFHKAEYNVASPRDEYDTVLSYIQRFTLPEKRNARITVQIDIDISAFKNFIDSSGNNEKIPMYLIDTNNNNILLKNYHYINFMADDHNKESDLTTVIKDGHLSLKAYLTKDQIYKSFRSAILGTTIIITMIVFLSILIAIYISRSITSPLHELFLSMKKVGKGNFSPGYPTTKYSEVDYLIKRFEKMVIEVNTLIITVGKKEREASEAKFQALQAKINPHFLYNTLDVIRSIALDSDNEDISNMTLSLSRLFRYNVGNLMETNTLDSEIEYLKDYLNIQHYRFGDRITTTFNIDDNTKNTHITRFILQPIVENSFKYGLELRGKGGELIISSKYDKNDLIISVSDNGPGIPKETLVKLQNSLKQKPSITSVTTAHGLDNVNLRIKLLYGQQYGLQISSIENIGTNINICIPIIRDNK